MARIVADGWAAESKAIAIDRESAVLVDDSGQAPIVASANHVTPYAYFIRGGVPEVVAAKTPLTYLSVRVDRAAPGSTFNRDDINGDTHCAITHDDQDNITTMRITAVAIALTIAVGLVLGACTTQRSGKEQNLSVMLGTPKRLADGKEWTTANLNVNTSASYCYDDAEPNCRRYGRLYTWESAQRGCQSLGDGWRLPTDDEWRQMAKHYGGGGNDSPDQGKAAYAALLSGGTSGFNAVLAGNRSGGGQYERLEAHGFYWTASDNDQNSAPFYNFGKGGQGLYRQPQGQKQMAVSARCIRQ